MEVGVRGGIGPNREEEEEADKGEGDDNGVEEAEWPDQCPMRELREMSPVRL